MFSGFKVHDNFSHVTKKCPFNHIGTSNKLYVCGVVDSGLSVEALQLKFKEMIMS